MAVLDGAWCDSLNIRSLVQAALARAEAAKAGAGGAAGDDDRRTAGADAVIAMARQLAGAGPMGSHHLLEAMTLVDDSLASGALGALGVAPDALAATIDELGTAGHDRPQPRRSRRPADGAAHHRRGGHRRAA